MQHRISTLLALALLAFALPSGAQKQSAEERKALFAKVKRVLVIPPFFGTNTLLGEPPLKAGAKKPAPPPTKTAEQEKEWQTYLEHLKRLERLAKELLPKRLQARTRYEALPQSLLQEAQKALEQTPQSLFKSAGRVQNGRFPAIDPDAIRRLAEKTQADALFITILDEPRKTNGGYYFNGIGFFRESAHVRLKGVFSLVLADGSEIFRHVQENLHPLTKLGERQFLLTDWEETEVQLFESLMDEFCRYAPLPTP